MSNSNPEIAMEKEILNFIEQGKFLEETGQLDEAIAYYRQILNVEPNNYQITQKLAEAFKKQGNLTEAIYYYQQAITINTLPKQTEIINQNILVTETTQKRTEIGTEQELFNQAESFYQQKNWQQTIILCQKILEINPNFAQGYKIFGNTLQQIGQNEQALNLYQKALEIKPDFAEVYANVGSIYAKQKDWQAALNNYEKAVNFNPKLAAVYRNIAKILKETGQIEPAIQATYQASLIEPEKTSSEEYYTIANYLLRQNQINPAILCLRKAIEYQPDFLEAYQELAKILQQQGELEQASECYRNLIILQSKKASETVNKKGENLEQTLSSQGQTKSDQLNKQPVSDEANLTSLKETNSAESCANLGSLYAQKQQWNEAISSYKKALEINPNLAAVYRNLARVYEQTDQQELATNCWYQAYKLEPETVKPIDYYHLGNSFLKIGQVTESFNCYRQAIQLKIDFSLAYHQIGLILIKQQKLTEAKQCFQQGIKQNPNDAQSYIYLSEIYSQEQDFQEALNCCFQALKIDPNNWQGYHNLGNLYLNQEENWEKAVECLRQAITINPKFSWSHHNLGEACLKLKYYQEAANSFQKAIEINPNFHWSYYNLGEALVKLEKWEEAANAYGKAQELETDLPKIEEKISQTLQHQYQEELEEAFNNYREEIKENSNYRETDNKGLEINPENAEILVSLGEILLENNKNQEAINCWEKAIAIVPPFVKTYLNLGIALEKDGKIEEAIALYQKCISLDPEEAWAYIKLGVLLFKEGQEEEAINLFQLAIIKDQKNPFSFIGLLNILIKQEKLSESALLCCQALKRHPENLQLQSLQKIINEKRTEIRLLKEKSNNINKYYNSLKREDKYENSPFYDGCIEKADSDFIVGWARDKHNPDRTLILDAYINDEFISSCKANKYRGDLASKFSSNGYYGFVIEIPKSLIFQNKISVNVKLRATNKDLRNSPIDIGVGSVGQKHLNYHQNQHFYLIEQNLYKYQDPELVNRNSPKVALIILNLNGAFVLDQLFASFQTYNTYKNVEIIVVDHNSQDESVKICEFWSQSLPVKIIARDRNYSFSESNNLAAQKTDASLLFFVNNDMMFCQDIIPELVNIAQDQTVGIVGVKLLDIIDSHQRTLPPTQHLGIQFNFYEQKRIFRPFDIRYSSHLLGVNSSAWFVPGTTGAAMMCKREEFMAVGGFYEGYFYGYEDVDLCLSFQRELKKNIVCSNNLAMFHHRGLTRFNNPSKTFALRQSDNQQQMEKRFGYYVRRRHLSDFFDKGLFWTCSPLRIGFAVTEASLEASAGDYFTALELGENLVEEFGWEVFYLSQKDKNWYDMSSLDVIVVMRDDYNLNELQNCKPSLVKIMWIRNWFERLTTRPWVGDYHLIWASSRRAVEYLGKELAKPVVFMPIATNNQRFQEAEFEPEFVSDYCFTGSYWNSPREIVDFLEPDNLPFDFALYGYNWETFDKFNKYYRGPLPYREMSKVYASTKIVVDDANIVTKEWGSVNSRVFDALSAGALVITNGKLGSDYVFDGLLPTFDSQESLEQLLREYLTNEPKRLALVSKLQTIVNEHHTYKHRAYTAFKSLQAKMSSTFRLSIKIGAPRWEGIQEWGDYHFALAIKRAFERKGHSVRIDILPEWDTYQNYGDDVVLVLRGLSEYKPKPYNINLMWNISHPDKISSHEYEQYDHIFLASLSYVEDLKKRINVPVESLLQCTDPDVFYPDTEGEEEVGSVVFVGNSRKVYRKIVKDALESGIKVDVYGTNWEYFISPDYLKGEHIPNEILRRYYTRADVILNDHWDTMSRYGFISNRLFDAAACGATIVSDQVSGLDEVFGDHILTYSSASELPKLMQETLDLKEAHREKRWKFSQYIRENHSFAKRVEKMLGTIEKLHQQKMDKQPDKKST